MGKRLANAVKDVDAEKLYSLQEAAELVKKTATAKFDESIELHVRLGIDSRQSEQQLRGTVALPNGTGKTRRVAVIAKGDKAKDAEQAGADLVGHMDLVDTIAGGKFDFDVLVATPDVMKDIAKLGRVLGPRGLMPNPKSGTVTFDVKKAVAELKAGRVEFKNDDYGILHIGIGKKSFEPAKILENAKAVLATILKMKPSSSKGTYVRSVTLSSTMGPGIKVNPNEKF
ncbi:MAG: 50S ribosomal protein L1 [Elusimicrobia bacterium CG1_02_63_36]|nr:MAG: 50S ribosomal protein L1 [Elusimicrobia bacterium CG1_02_63_36]PIP82190.1 MAG: 50S ribosomal protein L1 [Elusimicrobia bacterium CG22_combo_CG10-13_8_21_14_all_63_91]PJA12772.1 MAG: 50S ribosomal protein L1 [Elusimicrobia bacterium CG_4_10_14_0_2_um_filter_63_34]PJB22988.1 MAG: 50S ribosomal protein L1 [Elusimicrobia bacterium CG_4_9_14_3_um_filter_62_55]